MISYLQNLFKDKIASKPGIKTIAAPLGDGLDATDLVPNEFYFDIRLCELYLRNSREAGTSYVPRALSITECLYGNGETLTLPIAVGEHILAEIGEMVDVGDTEKAVTFSNCLLAGPMPYRGGDIGLFNGLYRVESGNIADSVFNLVADVTGNLGLDFTNYLNIGRQLTNRLPSLLGLDSGDWRIGHYAPIYKHGDDFFNRYLVLVSEGGDSFDMNALEIHNDNSRATLRIKNGNKTEPFDARDYMLIKLDSRLERSDYAQFGFHKRFTEVKKYLADRQMERAEWTKTELIQEIAECPDLTENHQLALIVMYQMKISLWMEKLGLVKKQGKSSFKGATNKNGDGLQTGAVANTANKKNLPPATVATLVNLSREWDGLHEIMENQDVDDFSDETVNTFLKLMTDKNIVSGSAADLVDAVKIHSLSQR